jgi:diguanylate cyclase (GGDEF)-like protein
MPTTWLASLSGLTIAGLSSEEAVRQALPMLRDGLSASEAYVVYADAGAFGRYGTSDQLDLDDAALQSINRDFSSHKEVRAFDLDAEGQPAGFRGAATRRSCDYVGTLIPMSMGELLLIRGPWPRGVGATELVALQTALPALALLLERRLDTMRAERQRHQLTALANITRVLYESEDLETILSGMASTIATATGVDYVTIDLCDHDGKVTLRCFNLSRPGLDVLRERWKKGAERPDVIREAVLKSRTAMIFPDAPNDERLPEAVRNFVTRTMTRSMATFPLLSKDDVLGVIIVASHKSIEFSPHLIEMVEGLAAQAATAVQAIAVYQELAASKRQLQRLNEQLQESMSVQHHLARADTLTGIPNRRYLDETLETECARASRYGQPLSVVMADLDNLKHVNDLHSHQRGDDGLRHVAHIAREVCRQADMVGRYGGDEFVFVLPATRLAEAAELAERFRNTLAASPVTTGLGESIPLTVSLGVAEYDSTTMSSPMLLIDRADRAMYAAKSAGRNRTMLAVGNEARAA